MDKRTYNHQLLFEASASLAVFVLLLFYSYGIFIQAPYAGFYFNPTNEKIEFIFPTDNSLLKTGDEIYQVGEISLQQFKADRRLTLFDGVKKGDVIEIIVIRDGSPVTIPWEFPGFTTQEFTNRLFNSWLLAYAFGIAGFAAQVTLRPRNLRRGLFIAANYLMAIFLISGMLSSWHLWESSTLLHVVSWFMMPIFIHLHWVFPQPFKRDISKFFLGFLYGIACLLGIGEIWHVLPRSIYALGFISAIAGSVILLVAHMLTQKKERTAVRLLLISTIISFSFSISVAIALSFDVVLDLGWVTFFSMPFMPLMYFYVIASYQSGDLQIKLNRFVSVYLYLITLGIFVLLIIVLLATNSLLHETWLFVAMAFAIVTGGISILFFPRFQAFVDQKFLGIKLPYQRLPEIYSSRIITSTSLPSLLGLLEKDVFPSLLIRQYAFLQASEKGLIKLMNNGIPDTSTFDIETLTQQAGEYIPSLSQQDESPRLILPLKVGTQTLGFWLLGKRDPDDLYPQVEIPILQSLANQTAIALSNILQTDQLRNIYESNIDRVEKERKRVARDLHDSVLNQLANMRNSLDQRTLPAEFLSTYDGLKQRIREIISDLRPPILDQGLAYAISELVEDLREEASHMEITLDLQTSGERIPEKHETHLFFIVREACMNVLKHANAKTLNISGNITPTRVELSIQDDGKGLKIDLQKEVNTLLEEEHFGLVGMFERARLINADLNISSSENSGTTIHITWQP
ncbi:MAG: ATP-binding protein [Anaerolineales bacterium]